MAGYYGIRQLDGGACCVWPALTRLKNKLHVNYSFQRQLNKIHENFSGICFRTSADLVHCFVLRDDLGLQKLH